MPNQTLEDLQALYRLFSKPGSWGKQAYYGIMVDPETHIIRPEDGRGFDPKKDNCFCLSGGMRYGLGIAFGDERVTNIRAAVEAQLPLDPRGGRMTIIGFNDDSPTRTQDDILIVIQKAINAEEAKAS